MEPNPDRYYRASGHVPFVGTILMQLFGAGAALVLGALYAAVNLYIPYILLQGFAVLVFGAGVGFGVNLGAKIGKVRNRGFIMLLGTATGVLAVYFAWVSYIYFTLQRQAWIFEPAGIFAFMKFLGQMGNWSLFSWTPTGWGLYAFWIVEAGIVIFLSLAVSVANDTPFCDYCNIWTKKADDVASFPLTDPIQLQQELEDENYEVLDRLKKERVDPHNRLKAIVHSCPNCEDSDFLTISHARVVQDKEGNETTNETELVKHLRIPRDLSEHLQELGVPAAYDVDEDEPKLEDEMEF